MNKIQVGILTFHTAKNYGAVLQTFALYRVLQSLGADVHIIDYRPKYLAKQYRLLDIDSIFSGTLRRIIRNVLYNCFSLPRRIKMYKGFSTFLKKHTTSIPLYKIDNNIDLFVVGSDQVWNTQLTFDFDNYYWGDFISKKKSRKISYASSFGHLNYEEPILRNCANLLSQNFDALSIREKDDAELLQRYTNKTINISIDPTLLLEKGQWSDIAIRPKLKEKFLLLYTLWPYEEIKNAANDLAKQLDLKIIEIGSDIRKEFDDISSLGYSPEEFIGLFEQATCILTSSFHGTIFSLIFNKPFYSFNLQNGSENRVSNLLESIGLQDRLIPLGDIPQFTPIDYAPINIRLDALKKSSIEYLINNLY